MLAQQTLNINNTNDIINTRMQVREAARLVGLDLGDQARISLAASSLLEGLGLGHSVSAASIAIQRLSEEKNIGLRVICTFPDPREHKPVNTVTGNIGWMVDDIAIHYLANGQVEIILTKWVVRRQS